MSVSLPPIPANARYLMVAPDVARALDCVPTTSVSGLLAFQSPGLDLLVNERLEPGTAILLDANRCPIEAPRKATT